MSVQAYDAVAGTQGLTLSRYVTPAESQRQFPTLSSAHDGGNRLKGTVRGLRVCSAPVGLQHQVCACASDATPAAHSQAAAQQFSRQQALSWGLITRLTC